MARTNIVLYQDGDGSLPPLETWLDSLPADAQDRCLARIALLQQHGHELDRPHAAYLGRSIYELRVKYYRVNYRMLYFFHGRDAVVISHGLAKEKEVPPREIGIAVDRMERFKANPRRHAFPYTPE